MQLSTLVEEAKTDYRAGRKQAARQKLNQAVRLDPHNHKLWLALAKLSESSNEALTILKKAQRYHPNQPDIQIVIRKLEPTVEKPIHFFWMGQRPLYFTIFTVLILLLFLGIGYSWQKAQQTAQPVSNRLEVAALSAENSPLSQTAVQPQQPAATQTPKPLNSKQLILSDAPRATWTITPTPSPTPTNTPTVLPTFVSSTAYTQAVRPFGVGDNERWIDINLFTQTLKAYEGDQLVFSTLVSSGLNEHRTVTGQFRIWLRFESQTMDGTRLGYDYYIENVPYVMYFFEDYAIHGAFWHNNFGNPMSHGCVNVAPTDAEWLFNWATLGTWVNVHY